MFAMYNYTFVLNPCDWKRVAGVSESKHTLFKLLKQPEKCSYIQYCWDKFEDTKGVSESLNRRKTDNSMTKINRTKGKHWSTEYYTDTNDRETRTSMKSGGGGEWTQAFRKG